MLVSIENIVLTFEADFYFMRQQLTRNPPFDMTNVYDQIIITVYFLNLFRLWVNKECFKIIMACKFMSNRFYRYEYLYVEKKQDFSLVVTAVGSGSCCHISWAMNKTWQAWCLGKKSCDVLWQLLEIKLW